MFKVVSYSSQMWEMNATHADYIGNCCGIMDATEDLGQGSEEQIVIEYFSPINTAKISK